jgi:hypothetical protein
VYHVSFFDPPRTKPLEIFPGYQNLVKDINPTLPFGSVSRLRAPGVGTNVLTAIYRFFNRFELMEIQFN